MKHYLCQLGIHKYKYSVENRTFDFKLGGQVITSNVVNVSVRKCDRCYKRNMKIGPKWREYDLKIPIKEERLDKLKNIYKKEKL